MKKVALAMFVLFTTLSISTMTSVAYATCGCGNECHNSDARGTDSVTQGQENSSGDVVE